ncbi:MAG TPA: gliding motility-associated ABC transporter ATP-binding subunit GldA, partial [Chitinophagales bacterium]|nr:gliding motility-associated ABC transporter ATP-binding subunit GldA [Chitinophagales bacterium]
KTILFSTHIMQEVQAVCDRVVIINKGKIVADATPENLQQTLSGNVQVEIEFELNENAESLKKIEEVVHVQQLSNTHFILQGRESKKLRKNIFTYATQKNNALLTLKEENKSLEDVFHELTK